MAKHTHRSRLRPTNGGTTTLSFETKQIAGKPFLMDASADAAVGFLTGNITPAAVARSMDYLITGKAPLSPPTNSSTRRVIHA